MLFAVKDGPNGRELKKMQLDSHPKCALFEQQIVQDESTILVRYHAAPKDPKDSTPSQTGNSEQEKTPEIQLPLQPDISTLEPITVDLHGSPASAYRMGDAYDDWFSTHFGIQTLLVYIGDGGRAILGTTLVPKPSSTQPSPPPQQTKGWGLSSLTSYLTGNTTTTTPKQPEIPIPTPTLTFTDVSPLLIASESSVRDVTSRFETFHPPAPTSLVYKFRPNIVLDGEGEEPFAEDFWAELSVSSLSSQGQQKILLTGNCVRCTSLNVDYTLGRPAEGEEGTMLKKLMRDRRGDAGRKWSPVFGRYGCLVRDEEDNGEGGGFIRVSVGDEVQVTRRNAERAVWDWPDL